MLAKARTPLLLTCALLLAAGAVYSAQQNSPPAEIRPAGSEQQPKKPPIHPDAERILKATSAALAGAKQFSFKAEAWSDDVIGGHKVSTTKTMQVQVSRPDKLQVEVRSPKRSRGVWYDGKKLTVLDRKANLYGTVSAPPTIDQMVDALDEQYGITFPLDDLLLSDPYAKAGPGIRGAAYFGKTTVLGVPCEHIGVGTDAVDWQLWVEDGGDRLPRKVVITYKLEDTDPQFTAIFSDWKLSASIPESTFTFSPPEGASEIEILRRKPDAE
jgi:hypothetical protein